MCLQVSEHVLDFQVGTTVTRSFQRTDGSSGGRVGIGTGRGYNMSGESGVVTTAVLCVKDQCDIQYLGFQFCIFSIRTEHQKNIFCKRKSASVDYG